MQEGKTIVRIAGVVTQLRAVHGEDRRHRRRLWGQRNAEPTASPGADVMQVYVDSGTDEGDPIMVEVPAESAGEFRVGQRLVIEVKAGATP